MASSKFHGEDGNQIISRNKRAADLTIPVVLIGLVILLIMALPGIQALIVLFLISGPILLILGLLLLGGVLPGAVTLFGLLGLPGIK